MTLLAGFEEVVRRRPDDIAVQSFDTRMTYAELAAASRRLAAHLRDAAGVRRGDHVAILLDPGADLIVSVLAVLRCGAAYVPLDLQSPGERNRLIVADSRPRSVIGDLEFPAPGAATIPADVVRATVRSTGTPPPEPEGSGPRPDDVCYVIYTSGTTGTPKGVPITHRNVQALFHSTRGLFDFTADDTWLLYHSIAFDFSVWEVWGPLLHGGRLLIPDRWARLDPQSCARSIIEHGVTVLNQTPTAFSVMSRALAEQIVGSEAGALRYVIFGGERLAMPALRPWVERFGLDRPALINMYGLTEATVHTTFHRVSHDDLAVEASVIGRPLPGFTARVIDENGAAGTRGELFVAGPQVASGYLERPELTAERFVPDPSGEFPDVRFYRTGDLVESRDGRLVYLGRTDRQVKIRGHRIELGEIEAAVRAVPDITDAAALVLGSAGEHVLACAYTTRSGEPIALRSLRVMLRRALPQYMLPTRFQWLTEMPLTTNGKANIRVLQEEMELNR
jgi:amino acid adenylation domain-containing protein